MLDNKELTDIVSALGCGMDDQYDPRPAPLRQGHPPDRRRQRRPPHRHPAPDLLLPPPPGPDPTTAASSSPARRSTRSPGARRPTGPPTTRPATASWPSSPRTPSRTSPASRGWARCPPSSSSRPPSTRPAAACSASSSPTDDRPYTERHRHRPDGQGARGPVQVHHGRGVHGEGYRYLIFQWTCSRFRGQACLGSFMF